MFFAIWYDARDPEFFTFENGDHLALSSGGGTFSLLYREDHKVYFGQH